MEEQQQYFTFTINCPPDSNPQRILTTAAAFITVLNECDNMLLRSFSTELRTHCALEQIEIGSLSARLRQILHLVDDDALQAFERNVVIGTLLVRLKYFFLRILGETGALPQKDKLQEMVKYIYDEIKKANLTDMLLHHEVSMTALAEQAKALSDVIAQLKDGESITYHTDYGEEATINADFSVTDDDISALLAERTIENTTTAILIVRKPDFLGTTKWDFKFNKRNLSVAIMDREWLSRYQNGLLDIRPGDALEVEMKEIVQYDARGEVLREDREILKVVAVKEHRPIAQAKLMESDVPAI